MKTMSTAKLMIRGTLASGARAREPVVLRCVMSAFLPGRVSVSSWCYAQTGSPSGAGRRIL
ncbi:MAG: hypothetical protein OXG81_11230 [Acidobacteria bacterium]|nr:hypothetical protein [Acidobacteriota bacterium]